MSSKERNNEKLFQTILCEQNNKQKKSHIFLSIDYNNRQLLYAKENRQVVKLSQKVREKKTNS
jgi:hypothetical protein